MQKPKIANIPTKYNGVTFRSRLEARWAVFLDAIGVEWLYEFEGYRLHDCDDWGFFDNQKVWYLLDFKLPNYHFGKDLYLEIKPSGGGHEEAPWYHIWGKICRLSIVEKTTVAVIYGYPTIPNHDKGIFAVCFNEGGLLLNSWWCNTKDVPIVLFAPPEFVTKFAREEVGVDENWRCDTPILLDAYKKAQTYRFW